MKYATLIAAAIGGLIIIGVVAWQIDETTYHVSTPEEYITEVQTLKDIKDVAHVVYPDDPQISGSLQVNKDKFLLGENIFIIIDHKHDFEVGTLVVLGPDGKPYIEYAFNAEEKESWKFYFRPDMRMSKQLCVADDIVGEWKFMMLFQGNVNDVMYEPITVTVLDKVLPGEGYKYNKNVCVLDEAGHAIIVDRELNESVP
tara:strand:- start:413 stop:1012 length:600 start_codon:yes stop_codon:yes gene_type:complete